MPTTATVHRFRAIAMVLALALAASLLTGCRTGTVTRVVDGDTLEIDGARFRLIGMDTPERGRCGFNEATGRMRALVGNKQVFIVSDPARPEAKDRYGRELAYIEIDVNGKRIDVGRTLIAEGLAIARYDSLDRYARHQRQDDYRRLDARTPDLCPRWAP